MTRPGPRTLPFWPPATIALAQIGAGLPSPAYAHYRARLGLVDGEVTALFAILVSLVMASLWWSRSAAAGRRRGELLMAALGAAAAGDVLFVLAGSYLEIAVASALEGVAVGLACGLAPAATVAALPDAERAGRWVTVANAAGMAAGPVLAGLGNEFLPLPYALVYLVHALACLVAAVPLVRAAPGTAPPVTTTVAPGGTLTRTRLRTTLATGYLSFCVGGLFVSLTAVLVKDVLLLDSAVAAGALIAAFFTANGLAGGLLARHPRKARRSGTALFVTGLVLAAVALYSGNLALLASASVGAGAGQGALVGGSVAVAARADSERGGNDAVALFFFWSYGGTASAALVVGWLSGFTGPRAAFLAMLGIAVAGLVCVALVSEEKGKAYA
ncbi:MFS transporter [Amycolatopsis samaneae]|uniref:MFS transporter n=1 Tax=Amycolatopsis samaneae TaxID=664691 RepID=A0ABW5GHC0_9PSEU